MLLNSKARGEFYINFIDQNSGDQRITEDVIFSVMFNVNNLFLLFAQPH